MRLFLLLLLFCSTLASAQSVERRSAPQPVLRGPLSDLPSPEGWGLLPSGTWDSRPGRIPAAALTDGSALDQADDLVSLETWSVEAGGKVYEMILRADIQGFYRYPTIKQDFQTVEMKSFYVLPEGSLRQIAEASRQGGRAQNVRLVPVLADTWFSKEEVQTKVAEFVRSGPPSYPRLETLNIAVFPVTYEGRDVVRFQVVEGKSYRRWQFDPLAFDHYYFESSTREFFEWLREPVTVPSAPASTSSTDRP